MTPILSITEVSTPNLPQGEYKGTWGGYNVRFEHEGRKFEAKTSVGIRTPNTSCIVMINDRGLFVRLPNQEKS